MLAAKFYCADDIRNISAARNQPRLAVDHGVVDFSRCFVTRVIGFNEFSAEFGFEISNCCFAQHDVLLMEIARDRTSTARPQMDEVFTARFVQHKWMHPRNDVYD